MERYFLDNFIFMDLSNIKSKFKNKQDLTFLSLGILMFIVVFVFVFYSIDVLAVKINDVLNAGKTAGVEIVKFNVDKIQSLEIDKMQN